MHLGDLVTVSAEVRSTRARSAKIEALAAQLRKLRPDEAPIAVSYLTGKPVQGRLGVGHRTLFAVEVAPASSPSLQIADVHQRLDAIAATGGPGSQQEKERLLRELLAAATADEQEFLRGLILRNLRQGALEGIMAEAVAAAAGTDADQVRRAVMLAGDLATVAAAVMAEGVAALDRFRLRVFTPVRPMLAQTAEDVAAALEAVGTASVEWKLDGARIQVHRSRRRVAVFTRNLRDITDQVPEIADVVRSLRGASLILDGEALVVADGRPVAFQDSISSFSAEQGAQAVTPFFFDCLYHAGTDLIDAPTTVRLEALDEVVPDEYRIDRIATADPDEAQVFYEAAVAAGHEGVMVKAAGAPYEAGRRGGSWLKVKPTHTLDLVILAAEWGSGRRRGWLSNLHLGARDPGGGFVMLGKTFKGLTDEMLSWQTERFLQIEERRRGQVVYLRPEVVYEIAFDGIQRSSRYPGGLALRFARVKRHRDDKGPADADTIETVRALFERRG